MHHEPTANPPPSRLPIDATSQDLTYHMEAAWKAIKQANTRTLFLVSFAGLLTRLVPDRNGLRLITMNEASFRNLLEEVAYWYKPSDDDSDPGKRKPRYPPRDVARAMLAEVQPPVPTLTRVVDFPVLTSKGTLVCEPGYDADSGIWYQGSLGRVTPPSNPSPDQIEAAKTLILSELLGDFPFADDASLAHAVGLMILPFVRPYISGPTPLHVIDAVSGQGTGKSLLADVLAGVALGRRTPRMAPANSEEEWRKRITSALMTAPTVVLIDNVQSELDSAALANALTAIEYEDRLLGGNQLVSLPVQCAWVVTGNAVRTSREIARRSVVINLDARTDQPWYRTHFRHPDLLGWSAQQREKLVVAVLTLIGAWRAAGLPRGKTALGSYEEWARVVGGILDVAGIPGFLSNLFGSQAGIDQETCDWREFVEVWWANYESAEVSAAQLETLAKDHDLLPTLLSGSRSGTIKLGMALARMVGRQVGGHRITQGRGDRKAKVKGYRLERLASAGASVEQPTAPLDPLAPVTM